MSESKKIVLFVCTGNSCRSPMAEYLFRARVGPDAAWDARSAGVFAPDGAPASAEAVEALREIGIDLSQHRSRGLTGAMVDAAELVVGLASGHVEFMRSRFPRAEGKIRLLGGFGPTGDRDIADPVGQSIFVYRRSRDEIDSAVSDLILHLVDHHGPMKAATASKGAVMKIAIGADHGGFELKEALRRQLAEAGHEVLDEGAHSAESVDYPDYAAAVAERVSSGEAPRGILVCTTGIGVSITANKFPGVRAALCMTPRMAEMSRRHNDANVLALGASILTPADAAAIVDTWLRTGFEGGGRHERRVRKIEGIEAEGADDLELKASDPAIASAIGREKDRQRDNLELIASENYVSGAVRAAVGSIMTNKYAEGYPAKRWYNGCEFVDEAERLAIERAKALFGAEHANVQPHCGSSANMAVYFAMLQPGDTLMAMSLADGGHLTHGHPMNFSGRFYKIVPYGVSRETERIDYDNLAKLAAEHKPRMICAGASAYSRVIDFPRLREIADSVGAWLMVDMAHIAGLVAGGEHPSPVPYADFVTTTTHKTLRGPRSGLILCRGKYAAEIDKTIFPGIQGGPLMHTIAAKAVCLHEAMQPDFKAYAKRIRLNAQILAEALADGGLRIVSGGTDNHLMLVDLTPAGLTGKAAASALDKAGITVNKNAIPFDTKSAFVTSGIRVGTPAVTTRGMGEGEMKAIASLIRRVLASPEDEAVLAAVRREVIDLTSGFPVP